MHKMENMQTIQADEERSCFYGASIAEFCFLVIVGFVTELITFVPILIMGLLEKRNES